MREVISQVDCLYAEDTRHTGKLCQHLGIKPRLRSLHEHNESSRVEELIARLRAGDNLGLVSDAGTPLISDPGYRIVAACHQHGIKVSPVAGPSSVIAALSVCGLPTNRFCFYGFLPVKAAARRTLLQQVSASGSTLVFFESRHRIVSSLADICELMGHERKICVARELTKAFESVMLGEASDVFERISQECESQKGEFVVVIRGVETVVGGQQISSKTKSLLSALGAEIAPKKAAAIVAEYSGANKKELYAWLVAHNQRERN